VKVSKSYLGKVVSVQWKDPRWDRVSSTDKDRSDVPRGRAALATWREYGVIDDITEGVVRIVHSAGEEGSRSMKDIGGDDFVDSWVPEELIESVTVYEPMREEPVGTDARGAGG
jgi:hypothetical protein